MTNYYDLTADPVAARPGMEFWMGLSASTDIAGDTRLLKMSINDKSRQDMQVGSGLFAMACPLNPFAMLLGMMMLSHLEGQYRSQHLSAHEEMLQRRIDMATALAAVQARRIMLDRKNKRTPSAVETIDNWISRKEPKKGQSSEDKKQEELKKKKQARLAKGEASGKDAGGALLPSAKSHTQVSKLLKAKSQLESQKFQLSKNQDYHGHASASAKLDVLDSILKCMEN
jgi:hypothetical protein